MVLDKIKDLLRIETGLRAQLSKEMNNLIKKERNITKALLLTKDGLPIYFHGLKKEDQSFFAVSISSFVSLVMKKLDILGLPGVISYVQLEMDNGNIVIAISKNLSLATFTTNRAVLPIVKTLTINALKKFEQILG